MNKSNNVLIIKSFSISDERENNMFVGELDAVIRYFCPVTGAHFKTFGIKVTGYGNSEHEALGDTIQNFINGKFNKRIRKYVTEARCIASKHISSIDIQVQGIYKEFFIDIFDFDKWEIPMQELG